MFTQFFGGAFFSGDFFNDEVIEPPVTEITGGSYPLVQRVRERPLRLRVEEEEALLISIL